jgi:hypothetical protein
MQTARWPASEALSLRNGEIVEVRSEREILATLDERGELESLQFMPEMLQFCGRRFRVYKRAVKVCDTINPTGMHRMDRTVHLEGLRCDGQIHGGCQAGCLLYWKEAWLKRVPDESGSGQAPEPDVPNEQRFSPARVPHVLMAATRVATAPSEEERFSCQATEIIRAAPVQVPWWDVRQYVRDVRAGNASALAMTRSVSILLFNKFQGANRRFLPRLPLIRGGRKYPFIEGKLTKTPHQELHLRPGELVRIKSKEEIVRTLDTSSFNRGLSFDAEMLKYCGRQARVLRRVERIIDEKTGRMLHLKNPCIILKGVTCSADYNQYCPRSIYPYWREIWLERVEE